ncbi:MAG: lipid-binding SYLF domain-containing protein, partial [Deltaproteobacteria bacterium]|nr:lipid-binding SYLF domain-containing protein [Deltaproteobacteria bacterium]
RKCSDKSTYLRAVKAHLGCGIIPALVMVFTLPGTGVWAGNGKEIAKVEVCADVIQQFVKIPDNAAPPVLLRNAQAIAIVPGIIKAGFIAGGSYGWGVVMVRQEDGSWSKPVFVTLAGGSLGFQAGVQSIDAIMVFKSRQSVERMARGKFTLGADAAAAAGPVGRSMSAGTDITLGAEVYTYSRSRGLFAGVSLEGSGLQIDYDATDKFYGLSGLTATDVFTGNRISEIPPVATHLLKVLTQYTQ